MERNKSKYKVGDTVICKAGYEPNDHGELYGGWGYKPYKIFTITHIRASSRGMFILESENELEAGVWDHAVELYKGDIHLPIEQIYKEIYKDEV